MTPTRKLICTLIGAVGALAVRIHQLRSELSDLRAAHQFIREAYTSHVCNEDRHNGTSTLRVMPT